MCCSSDHNTRGQLPRCDLHTHSIFSDGTWSPAALIAQARRLGLIIALTDHNTVDGLAEFLQAAEEQGVTAVPGIELSTEHNGKELHLVGLFIRPEYYPVITRLVKEQHVLKEISNMEMIERLNQAGYQIDYLNVKRRNPGGNANRAHVAAELMALGYVSSVQEAFETLLKDDGEFYVPPARLQMTEAIQTLRHCGALPILAHPLQELSTQELRDMLPDVIAAGLLGMETMHSSYTPEMIAAAEQIAAEYKLLPSGGSDFHGQVKPDIHLGTGKGNLCIPLQVYTGLCAARDALDP